MRQFAVAGVALCLVTGLVACDAENPSASQARASANDPPGDEGSGFDDSDSWGDENDGWCPECGSGGGWGSGGSGGGWDGAAQEDTSHVVFAATPPPPLSGGTLVALRDGTTLVAADPDRDLVWIAAVDAGDEPRRVALAPHDEPGRLVEDGEGRVHVALRRGGAVATIDPATGTLLRRTPVCPAPRGITYEALGDVLVVACAGGELVSIAASDGSSIRSLSLARDLRDVVSVGGGYLAVTWFRSAEVALVDPTGSAFPPARAEIAETAPSVAWRAVAVPGEPGAVAVAHQRALATTIDIEVDGWMNGNASSMVTSEVSLFRFDLSSPQQAPTVTSTAANGALPVDLALSSNGARAGLVTYGDGSLRWIQVAPEAEILQFEDVAIEGITSVVTVADGRVVAFAREPARLVVSPGEEEGDVTIDLPASRVFDTGHALFHAPAFPGGSLACASCHPEGRDDGRVWQFAPIGPRRTPSLVGGLLDTAPFHWSGDLASLDELMDEVFTRRMGGLHEDAHHVAALARFLDRIPRIALAPPFPSAEREHGKQLFESDDLGCTACHTGPHLTSNQTVDVGTGLQLQVPSLIGVGMRAPYLHDGCAATLADRFGPCGGGDEHGHTSQLSAADVADLVLYLESL